MNTTRASLLVRIRDLRDAEAWKEFDAIYRAVMTRFALARGLDANQAEDIVQHCLLAVQTYIGGFDYDPKKGRFKAWLRTLVNNRVRKLLAARREPRAGTADLAIPQIQERSPEELFEQAWMREHLRHCLQLLRAEIEETPYRAFQRYVLDEQLATVVCAECGLTADQLYRIKWRITEKLREKMVEMVGDDEPLTSGTSRVVPNVKGRS